MVKRISEKLESEKAVMSFHKSNELDPLDNEILERAFDATLEAIKQSDQRPDFETDEGLEAALRRELIARFNGISYPKTLKDILWLPAYRCWLRISSFQSAQCSGGHFARTAHLVQMNSVVEVFSPSACKAKPSLTASTLKRTLPMKG